MLLKIITSYSPSDFGTSKSDIIDIVLQFASNLVQYSNIKIEDGKRNPFQRAFELVAACLEDVKNGQEETFVKQAAQNVLEKGLSRLINNE